MLGIRAHDQNIRRFIDLGPQMGHARRNDHDIAGSDVAACSALNRSAQSGSGWQGVAAVFRVNNGAAGSQSGGTRQYDVDLGDPIVGACIGRSGIAGNRLMDHGNANVIFSNVQNFDYLIVAACGLGVLLRT